MVEGRRRREQGVLGFGNPRPGPTGRRPRKSRQSVFWGGGRRLGRGFSVLARRRRGGLVRSEVLTGSGGSPAGVVGLTGKGGVRTEFRVAAGEGE